MKRLLCCLPILLSLPIASALPTGVLQVCPEQSLVTIFVDRGAGLSRLGHQHLISIHNLQGEVQLQTPVSSSTATVRALLSAMAVDEPGLRKAAGMEGELSKKSIAKTRRNMLTKVLAVSSYPEVSINITEFKLQQGDNTQGLLNSVIGLQGQALTVDIPATIELDANRLHATGQFKINQSDFGIKPFSTLLGMIAIADELLIKFDVVASKIKCH